MIHLPFAQSDPYDIRIWQCTDFARHWHSSTEIYICLQGQMKICVEGTMYQLSTDDTVFVAGNEAHEIFCDTPETRVILISFGYALLGSDYSTMQELSIGTPCLNLCDDTVPPQLLFPLLQIKDALYHTQSGNVPADWIFRSSLYAIASYLCRHDQTKPISEERLLRAKQLEKMSGTLRYISEHFHEPITVEQAANMAGYDRSYFCKQFRKTTGMTFHRYLNYYRVSVACQLLADAKLPLSVVADRVGFACQKNLSRLFREVLGMTPTQYKKLPLEVKNSVRPL